ncbi:MAG: molecular chaperone DnaK [bacterium]
MNDLIIGIDLGTTNSVAAILEGGEARVIPTAEGNNLCPSVVGFTPSGECIVGEIAKRQLLTHPARTIASVKRHMGTKFTFVVDGRVYTPQEISAFILRKLRKDVETYLGMTVEKAVITVPAYFSDAQRQATKDAGRIAGLDVVRIVNEPTAAALAYGADHHAQHRVLVWDLGGGTFDVSILEIGEGLCQVLATNGDTHLGGDDWDGRLISYLMNLFHEQEGIDLAHDRLALQRLKQAAESAKIHLSDDASTTISLPFLAAKDGKPAHLNTQLSRLQFEALTHDLRDRMVAPTLQALDDSRLSILQIEQVLLVGGSTRIPSVRRMVKELLDTSPVTGVNPDEVVALGAAIQGGIISGSHGKMLLLDVTPLSLGIETADGIFTRIIPRNSTIPTSETKIFTTSEENQEAVDIHVLQGERDLAIYNKSLGRFALHGIAPAPKGYPRINVTFDIDENGIAHISAVDRSTGAAHNITLTPGFSLHDEEIQRMVDEANLYASIDNEVIELTELQRKGEDIIVGLNQKLDKLSDLVPIPELARIDHGLIRMRAALQTDNAAELRAALDACQDLYNNLVEYELGSEKTN